MTTPPGIGSLVPETPDAPSRITRRSALCAVPGAACAATVAAAWPRPATAAAEQPGEKAASKGASGNPSSTGAFRITGTSRRRRRSPESSDAQASNWSPPNTGTCSRRTGWSAPSRRSHGFVQGMNNPKYQEQCIDKLRQGIDALRRRRLPQRDHLYRHARGHPRRRRDGQLREGVQADRRPCREEEGQRSAWRCSTAG